MELQTVSKKERVRRKFTDVGHLCPARRTLTNMLRSFTLLARAVLLASLIGTACAQAPPPPGQFVDNAPDGACCVASWGTPNADCTNCYSSPGFTCRDSHQHGSVDTASKDCISFEYATEAACTAAGGTSNTYKWAPSLNMFCARNDTQHLARSGALGADGKGAATLAIVSALTALALALT